MFNKINFLVFLFYGLHSINPITAQEKTVIRWSVLSELPSIDHDKKNPGLAGAFSGISKNVLIIAGGSNFPDRLPWQGGTKTYWDDIYVLQRDRNDHYEWNAATFKLGRKNAYGASVTLPEGIFCAGGENSSGILNKTFLLQWDPSENKIVIKDLPDLPLPLTNLSATSVGNLIYVAGGETIHSVSGQFFCLDMKSLKKDWKKLADLPKPVSHSVLIAQSDGHGMNLYLIGGRKKNANGISDLYNSVYKYNLNQGRWYEVASLPYALSAASGIGKQKDKIFVFGGDKGETFHKTELLIAAINETKDEKKKQELTEQKNKLQSEHPGFNKEILMYDTKKNKWTVAGVISFPAAVTTTACTWSGNIVIPCGEIRAGIRTPEILLGKFYKWNK